MRVDLRRVWIYQRNSYIKEKQTTQGQKEKVQKDKQRSTKHTNKTKDRATRTPSYKQDEKSSMRKGLGSVYDKCKKTLSFVTQIFRSGQPSHGGDRQNFDVMPST